MFIRRPRVGDARATGNFKITDVRPEVRFLDRTEEPDQVGQGSGQFILKALLEKPGYLRGSTGLCRITRKLCPAAIRETA